MLESPGSVTRPGLRASCSRPAPSTAARGIPPGSPPEAGCLGRRRASAVGEQGRRGLARLAREVVAVRGTFLVPRPLRLGDLVRLLLVCFLELRTTEIVGPIVLGLGRFGPRGRSVVLLRRRLERVGVDVTLVERPLGATDLLVLILLVSPGTRLDLARLQLPQHRRSCRGAPAGNDSGRWLGHRPRARWRDPCMPRDALGRPARGRPGHRSLGWPQARLGAMRHALEASPAPPTAAPRAA